MGLTRIATWPVNGVRARLPYLLHWLNARKPDIVALQKIREFGDRFPLKELNGADYFIEENQSSRTDYGVALLTRKGLGRCDEHTDILKSAYSNCHCPIPLKAA